MSKESQVTVLTQLSVKDAANTFRDVIEESLSTWNRKVQGVAIKWGEIRDRESGVFDKLKDAQEEAAFSAWAAKTNRQDVWVNMWHIYVFDRGTHREVHLWAIWKLLERKSAEALVQRSVEKYHHMDSEAQVVA